MAVQRSWSCKVTVVQGHDRARLRSCNVTVVQSHGRARSRSCKVTVVQRHGSAKSRSCKAPFYKPLFRARIVGNPSLLKYYRALLGLKDFLMILKLLPKLKVNDARHFLLRLVAFLYKPIKSKIINGEGQLQALVDGKKILITESTVRRDLQLEDAEGVDCLHNDVIFEQLTLMGEPRRKVTEVPQPSDLLEHVTDEAVNEDMDDSLVRAATTASSIEAKQDSSNINKSQSKATPNEPGVNTPRSDEDSLKLKELMELCTTLQSRVLALEQTKAVQANENDSLKRWVQNLKKKQSSRTHKLKRLYKVGLTSRVESSDDNEDLGEDESKQGRISDINADEEDKGKGIMVKEHVKLKKKDQIQLDEEVALKLQAELQAEFDKKQRLTGERAQQEKELNSLKNKSFANIQELFDKAMKKVNTFVDYKTELVEESSKKDEAEVMEGSSKRAGIEREQESSKKQKIDDDISTFKLITKQLKNK
nr:hypothetical protein [Tanacetum cinerariifolium]